MRWLQPRWRVVDKRPKLIRSKYKNGKKNIIQKIDLHKAPIVSVNAVLSIPLKVSLQSPRKVVNLYFFFENFDFYFSSLRSYGGGECSDYNVAEGFLTNGGKYFAPGEKTLKKHIF